MSKEVAESCFAMLHMEMVALAAGDDVAEATPAQLQVAARRLESAGFEVGLRLVERHSKDRARFADTLDIIKFICKDFWYEVYRKQIDKLQTNNRGVFMLQDNKHRLLSRCSPSLERQIRTANRLRECLFMGSAKELGSLHAKFPCGLIRGALYGLGVNASVGVEVHKLTSCQFTIRIQTPDTK
mmetsp:Transcript_8246/g.16296  ORF Transcript_8246/g.16296 Transcript_8246/m.16296 type:complete len:184 (-) Transcript_8246:27-578(-)